MLLLMYPLLFLPLFTMAETTEASMIIQERWKPQLENWRRPADWIGDGILNVAGTVLPVTRSPFDGIRGNSSSRCIYIYVFLNTWNSFRAKEESRILEIIYIFISKMMKPCHDNVLIATVARQCCYTSSLATSNMHHNAKARSFTAHSWWSTQ